MAMVDFTCWQIRLQPLLKLYLEEPIPESSGSKPIGAILLVEWFYIPRLSPIRLTVSCASKLPTRFAHIESQMSVCCNSLPQGLFQTFEAGVILGQGTKAEL
jgi:hypothetical protein